MSLSYIKKIRTKTPPKKGCLCPNFLLDFFGFFIKLFAIFQVFSLDLSDCLLFFSYRKYIDFIFMHYFSAVNLISVNIGLNIRQGRESVSNSL